MAKNEKELLERISIEYRRILKNKLVGIYVHGSIAFGCFNWEKSDIDFLVVTEEIPTSEEKERLIEVLLRLEKEAPPKGFEMSVILEKYCGSFVYPTPFELHFSNAHMESCRKDLKAYCQSMNGTDKDLAAHITVIQKVGIVLCGKEIKAVFGAVPWEHYLDSIKCDIEDSENEITDNPVYVILNLCRVLAYTQEGLVLSKAQGGLWGLKNLPVRYEPVVRAASRAYDSDAAFVADSGSMKDFSKYMKGRIFIK